LAVLEGNRGKATNKKKEKKKKKKKKKFVQLPCVNRKGKVPEGGKQEMLKVQLLQRPKARLTKAQ